jgi:FMN-dependent NADH-azoreductase
MEHYLKTLFAFIGITDVEVFQSQGLMVPQLKDENLAKTVAQIEELV